jgi:hypothetical protein
MLDRVLLDFARQGIRGRERQGLAKVGLEQRRKLRALAKGDILNNQPNLPPLAAGIATVLASLSPIRSFLMTGASSARTSLTNPSTKNKTDREREKVLVSTAS